MSLRPGTRLGPYEVLGPLGSGGMGEVYRARDPRLGREVAIKVLPADRLSDSARRARFEQEARAVAALNHPGIVTIHELESADGIDFIVMELVAGRTLDALIRHGMRLGEALRVVIPLADAFGAAHTAGIVHRDLKPANVMVTPEGAVKVLDFGLAKLLQSDEGGDEDATTLDARVSPPSGTGTVAGTPAYMSPEQASGGKVDARSDIFSFGAVFYEMVTGRRAFAGGSRAETLAAVFKEQPKPPSEWVTDLPKELERIILRCLRKEPERRFQNMLDVKIELQEVKGDSDSQATAPGGVVGVRRRSRRHRAAWAAAGFVVLATAAGLTVWRLQQPERPVPRLVQLTSARRAHSGGFSPDGSQIVFTSTGDRGENWDIWLKIVGEPEARRLTTDPAVDESPSWSPDGTQIAFVRTPPGAPGGAIYLVSPLGGSERRLSDFPTRRQLSWSADGRWLAAARARAEDEVTPESGGIHLIPAAGGQPRPLTSPKAPAFDTDVAFSPDGRALAYVSCEGAPESEACNVYLLSLDGDLRPRGAPRRLTRQGFTIMGLAWTRDGASILYGTARGPHSHVWRVATDGTPPVRQELAGPGTRLPSTARSRDRLMFTRVRFDVHLYRLQVGGTATRLTESSFRDYNPQYSADGRRVAFGSDRADERDEIWLADTNGTNLTRLTRGPGRAQGSPRWSPDGRTIAFDSMGKDGHYDIWTTRVDGSGLKQATSDPTDENMPSFSRDGRFLYYGSNRTGRYEIWRVPIGGGREEQVTQEGGFLPFESLDGRTLYYKRAQNDSPLLARPTAGGEERIIAPCVHFWGYAVDPRGVFHVDCDTAEDAAPSRRSLRHWDAATGSDQETGALDLESGRIMGLSASPDGTSLLYALGSGRSELMMIDNFY